jgi:hypothetical protein
LNERGRQSYTEQQLRQLLALKEKSIQRLEKRYLELKYSSMPKGRGGEESLVGGDDEQRRGRRRGSKGRQKKEANGERGSQTKEQKILEQEIRKEMKRNSAEAETDCGVKREKPRRSKSASLVQERAVKVSTRYPQIDSPFDSREFGRSGDTKTRESESIWDMFLGLSDHEEDQRKESRQDPSKVRFSHNQMVTPSKSETDSESERELLGGQEMTTAELKDQSRGPIMSPPMSPLAVDQLLARHSHEYVSSPFFSDMDTIEWSDSRRFLKLTRRRRGRGCRLARYRMTWTL